MHLSSTYPSECYQCSRFKSGTLTAHKIIYLPLLPSGSDGVHRVLLRKTQLSLLLAKGKPHKNKPLAGIPPCYSGLQVQGTANSPPSTTKTYLITLSIIFKTALFSNGLLFNIKFRHVKSNYSFIFLNALLILHIACSIPIADITRTRGIIGALNRAPPPNSPDRNTKYKSNIIIKNVPLFLSHIVLHKPPNRNVTYIAASKTAYAAINAFLTLLIFKFCF